MIPYLEAESIHADIIGPLLVPLSSFPPLVFAAVVVAHTGAAGAYLLLLGCSVAAIGGNVLTRSGLDSGFSIRRLERIPFGKIRA